ncbi:MAG: hypothetical protein OEY97_01615 [Nitrospirota bacterium]|nr:hypothetical protein [Nitrospirota bacterium]
MGNTPIYMHQRAHTPRTRFRLGVALLAVILLSALALAGTPAAHAQGLAHKLPENVSLDLRLRYEFEEKGNFPNAGSAGTVMTRAGYLYKHSDTTQAFAELEGVFAAITDYNDTTSLSGWFEYPAIQDPDGYGLNQAYVSFVAPMEIHFVAGRQRLSFANERHIGPDLWRQNDRTFDSAMVSGQFLESTDLDTIFSDIRIKYAYVFGVNQPDFEHRDIEAQLFDLEFAMWSSKKTRVGFYSYLIDDNDFNRFMAHDLTSATFGWRYQREYRPINGHAMLFMEAAMQDNYQAKPEYNNDPRFLDKGTEYYLMAGEYRLGTFKVSGGYEVFTSTSRVFTPSGTTLYYAFQTPWASNNNFNGWRDGIEIGGTNTDFTIPMMGLNHLFVTVEGNLWGTDWLFAYHRSRPENTQFGHSYGPEFNVGLKREITRESTLGLRFIAYDDDFAPFNDVRRAIVYYEASF